jgi:hypothetical protein
MTAKTGFLIDRSERLIGGLESWVGECRRHHHAEEGLLVKALLTWGARDWRILVAWRAGEE